MEVSAKTRYVWIDVCKGIGIILVVLGHSQPPFYKFIYGFHMPLFFMISGYLYNDSKSELTGYTYAKKLLYSYIRPYFILSILNLMICLSLGIVKNQDTVVMAVKYVKGILWSYGSIKWMPNCSPLWFLTGLFVTMLLFHQIIRKIKMPYIRYGIVVLSVLTSYSLYIYRVGKLPWNLDSALMALAFVSIGYELKINKILYKIKHLGKLESFILITSFTVTGIIAIKYNPVNNVDVDANIYGNLLAMIIGAVTISTVIMLLCYMHCNNGIVAKILSWIGRHTVFIIGFDYFSSDRAISILHNAHISVNWVNWFVLKCAILFCGMIIWYSIMNVIKNKRIYKIINL